jgi:hypothetical protein
VGGTREAPPAHHNREGSSIMDINNTRIASVIQRLSPHVSDREWKLVLAAEWHCRLVDRLQAGPPVGTTITSWLGLHLTTLHSAQVVGEMMRAQGDPWTECLPNLTHLIVQLKENIDYLKRFSSRYGNRRAIPQTAR